MLDFKRLELSKENVENISAYFKYNKLMMCDYTTGGMFMWRDFYQTEYAELDDTIIFKHDIDGKCTAFSYPLGEDTKEGIKLIDEYCKVNNLPRIYVVLTKKQINVLKKHYKELETTKERDWFDYIYKSEDIINLIGNKYRTQRNHINRFKRDYSEFSFEEISTDNINELDEFFTKNFSKAFKDSATSIEETKKVKEVLDNYDTYGLIGGILRVNGEIIAFSIGEKLNDTLHIHIERALLSYQGSYAMLVNQFAKHFVTDEIKYINREEDVGDEGLRKSKMSYRPCCFVEKYTVEVIK